MKIQIKSPFIPENYRSFEREIRTNYFKGTRLTFREFLRKCESILDKVD